MGNGSSSSGNTGSASSGAASKPPGMRNC
jgi:hypothetical protein